MVSVMLFLFDFEFSSGCYPLKWSRSCSFFSILSLVLDATLLNGFGHALFFSILSLVLDATLLNGLGHALSFRF